VTVLAAEPRVDFYAGAIALCTVIVFAKFAVHRFGEHRAWPGSEFSHLVCVFLAWIAILLSLVALAISESTSDDSPWMRWIVFGAAVLSSVILAIDLFRNTTPRQTLPQGPASVPTLRRDAAEAPSQEARMLRSHVTLHLLTRRVTVARSMNVSEDPILDDERQPSPQQELLLSLYSEICTSWRALVDVRFKLLAFVPTISAALLSALLLKSNPKATAGVIIATFGLVVTIAIAIYDQRNSQLHDELISRARRIERDLGLAVGQFLGRPGSWRFVKHDTALLTIYGATAAAWLAGIMFFVVEL
jgi:hypothetical protein